MRPSQSDRKVGKICIPIIETDLKKSLSAIKRAGPLADLIELRLDYMKNPELPLLLNGRRKPFIVTNRRREEGGQFQGDEGARVQILEEAISLDVDYVDIEMRSPRPFLQTLMAHQKAKNAKTRIILSYHDFRRTPPQRDLEKLCDRMVRLGADVVKIVTLARSWEDNLNLLALIPYAKEREQKIVAFCMGGRGKMSRVIAPLVGAAWTYASSITGKASAPGQMTVREMSTIWERLR